MSFLSQESPRWGGKIWGWIKTNRPPVVGEWDGLWHIIGEQHLKTILWDMAMDQYLLIPFLGG